MIGRLVAGKALWAIAQASKSTDFWHDAKICCENKQQSVKVIYRSE